jgi:hypothetical protein
MSVMLDWMNTPFMRAMRKKSNLSSDGGDSGRKKPKRGYGGIYGGA